MNLLFRLAVLLVVAHEYCCISTDYGDQQSEEIDPQEVEEAQMKIHFSLMTESRQLPAVDNRLDANASANMDRMEFEQLVQKINEEVSALKSQALILSKAYQSLLAKYKSEVKKHSECSQQNGPNGYSGGQGSNQGTIPQPTYSNIPTSITTQRPPASNYQPEACNCKCQFTCPVCYESKPAGNTYNYYINGGTPAFLDHQQSFPQHFHPTQQHAFTGPPVQSYQTLVDKPNRVYSADPDNPDAAGADGWRSKPLETLHDLHQHLDPKVERWKQKFFDRHELRKLEKQYSPDEIRSLFQQWQLARL